MVLHSMNFPTEDAVLDLIKLNVEQERTVDPGIPCDTIIVNNDVGWEKGNRYLDSINNSQAHSGIIRVLHRGNWGRSFGAYNEAYQRFRDEYEYWIFTEDDIFINGDNYFKIARDNFNRHDKTGFVALLGISNKGLYSEIGESFKHAHSGAGITHVKILDELNRKLGKLPHSERTESQTYEDCIYNGEIAFTNEIIKLGYELKTIESDVPLHWFAYDFMRGKRVDLTPRFLPLMKWKFNIFVNGLRIKRIVPCRKVQ
jgi:hypothetical protein